MERNNWGRIGPIGGVLLAAMFIGLMVLGSLGDQPSYVSPAEPAEDIARFLEATSSTARAVGIASLVAVLLLVVFVADAFERFRSGVPIGGRWLANTFLAGGVLVAVGFVIQGTMAVGVMAIDDFGTDVQTARALHAMSTNALAGIAPGVVLMTGAAAALSLRYRLLPRWLAVVALAALVINFLAYWVMAWMLWVLGASIVLLANPDAAGEPVGVDATTDAIRERA